MFTDKDITIIIDNIIEDVCNFLSDITDIIFMQDEIINARVRIIMKITFGKQLGDSILRFINFIDNDDTILRYIARNNKLTYGTHHSKDIHTYIYDYLYEETIYSNDFAQGWLNWNDYKEIYQKDGDEVNIHNYALDKLIKYVFKQYNVFSNKFVFINEDEDENDDVDDAEKNSNNSEDNNNAEVNLEDAESEEDSAKQNECVLS